jgi:hypothetical protein
MSSRKVQKAPKIDQKLQENNPEANSEVVDWETNSLGWERKQRCEDGVP